MPASNASTGECADGALEMIRAPRRCIQGGSALFSVGRLGLVGAATNLLLG